MTQQKKILVTSALPYANGPLHLGHLVEHIQTDIWVRWHKMQGHVCIAVCGEDAHGTPIMIKAEREGVSAETLIAQMQQEHERDFDDFYIHYDYYHTTHSEENRELSYMIYRRLQQNGDIKKRTIEQMYDPVKHMFLPDRYIKGQCPACNAEDQYGDSCEACGATYHPNDLINPVSVVSDAIPEERESEHFFFDLPKYEGFLKQWIHAGHLQTEVANKLNEWFDEGLQQWDISRDSPYFGFEIPDHPGKYFYVWLDAPVGYMASFKKFCQQAPGFDFDEFWQEESQTELYHFVGKDIIYFHALFWPAMLKGAGLRTPTAIFSHGFLTVNGQKMSKSRGTFIKARTYSAHLNPEYLRYYFAAKLSDGIEDIDLNFNDFMQRVNSDLVGKVVNIASRCAGFIHKKFAGMLAAECSEPALLADFVDAGDKIGALYCNREYSHALRLIMGLADRANQYIDAKKPWVLVKEIGNEKILQQICSLGINLFRILIIYLKPVLPKMAEEVEAFLNVESMDWASRQTPLLDHQINPFKPLIKRIDEKQITELKEAAMQDENTAPSLNQYLQDFPIAEQIDIAALQKVDLRIAEIVQAEYVDGADKLLKLQVDLGGDKRQVFAGIRLAYAPEKLVGKLTVVVANLKPRKMRFGISEAMVLAAGAGGKDLWILSPDPGAKPGMRIT